MMFTNAAAGSLLPAAVRPFELRSVVNRVGPQLRPTHAEPLAALK